MYTVSSKMHFQARN